ncbi:PKD/REJ-like domain [Cinara cedri]|uniref:PKD/REJ-like domain n=1 Tax=Cinara cedri TaxID=506608 RepID=A0A5E4LXX5_9HEMI|nr:PKD/REJ-like domain [Cinara cedri]
MNFVYLVYPITSIHISPFIYDVQNNIDTVIRINGLETTMDTIQNTTCEVMDLDSRIIMNTNLNLSNTFTLLARFETPISLGAFKIQCSIFGSPVNFDGNFLLVNSLHLIVGNVEPNVIKLGESVSFRLEIFNLTEPVLLLCYLTDGEDYIILPTNSINGNKLSTWITCPEYKLNRAAEYKITVVYSTSAIDAMLSSNNFKVVTVQANRPKLILSGFTKDLRTIWFKFDQNIEGPDSCNDIFTSITLSQIGYDAVCWFSSNYLTVLLGNVKTVKDNKFIIQYSSNNNIRTYRSWSELSPSMLNNEIIVPIVSSEVPLPVYWLYGPRQFCNIDDGIILGTPSYDEPIYDCSNFQFISVSTIGSLILKYSPILSFNDLSNSAITATADESSNRASLIRDSVRNLVIMINRQNFTPSVCLSSALMLPYVEYILEVTGTNILNQSGLKKQLKFKLIETHGIKSRPKIQIVARPIVSIGSEAVFETIIYPTCGEPVEDYYNNLQYSWYFVTEYMKYNIVGVNGPVLILDTNRLHQNKTYTVGCELYNENSILEKQTTAISKDEIQFEILPFDAKAVIVPSQIVVAFGRSIHLKARHQNYVTLGDVQYKWFCKTTNDADCLMIGNYPELKEAMDDKSSSTSSELIIHELTLQPGRYYFVVQISLSGIKIDTAVSVVVVSFEHGPHIMFYWPDGNFNPSTPLPPGSKFILAATVSYLTSDCLITWTTSSDLGYSYLSSKYLGGKDIVIGEFTPGRNETSSRDVRLVVTLPNKSVQNTNFLLKLNIYCASLKHSMFGSIPVPIVAPPHIFKLEVTPNEGIGLLTRFRFFTNTAYETKSNHPLRYSFGFYMPVLTSTPIYFYSSTLRLQTETILPSVNSGVSKIKTVLKVCNTYESCSIIEGPEISIRHPTQLLDTDVTSFIQKYKRMLIKQMLTESEAYIIAFMTTLNIFKTEVYEKTTHEIHNVLSTYINNIIESVSYGKEYIPIGLALMDSISRTFFVLPKLNNIVISQSLVLLRDQIYEKLIAYDNTLASPNAINNIRYIFKNVNSNIQNIYSQTRINKEVVKSFLEVSEILILNQEDGPYGLNEKKKLLNSIENYAKHICFTLSENEELYIGSLVGSFSVQQINSFNSIKEAYNIPSCNSDFHRKCIKQKSKITINKNLFISHRTEFPLCFLGFHLYDDFFTQVYGNNGQFLKRHSGLYGFHIMKMNNEGKSNYESVVSNPLNLVNIVEIPVQSTINTQLECRYWNGIVGWTNEGCKFLGIVTKLFYKFATCECPAFKYYAIFSKDFANIPLDNSVSDSKHNKVIHNNSKALLLSNSSIVQRSLSDIYIAFKINGNPSDLSNQNLRELENSLSRQLADKVKSISSVMRELKIMMSDPIYVTLHLMQTVNFTTDESIQDLVKKLSDGSLILYDLHRYRLYVPEQPLRIMQPRYPEFDNTGKNIALFFAIIVAFLACFVFGSILLKRHQLLADVSDVQQNITEEDDHVRRPKYKKLESTEFIEQNPSSEQRFRHFNNNVELSDSGITLHSDRTQINLLQQLR